MHKKKILTLAAAAVCAAAIALAGCGSDDVTSGTNTESASEELSVQEESAESYVISLTSRWYDADGNSIGNASIEIYNDGQMIYTGTTSAQGSLATCAFPSDTKLKFVITSEDGTVLAKSNLNFKVSDRYSEITITPLGEETTQALGLPVDSTSVSAAFYINENAVIEAANITRNTDNSGVSTSEEDADEGTDDSGDASAEDSSSEDSTGSAEDASSDADTDGESGE